MRTEDTSSPIDFGTGVAARTGRWRAGKTRLQRAFTLVGAAGILACVAVAAARCGGLPSSSTGPTPLSTLTAPAGPARPAVLVGAGDIGVCGSSAAAATGQLLDGVSGTVFTTGDNAYPNGSEANFRDCYEPYWGTPSGPDQASGRQPRIRGRRRRAVLQLLRGERRSLRTRLLQLSGGLLARGGAEFRGAVRSRVRPDAVASRQVVRHPQSVHPGLLAQAVVQFGPARPQREHARDLARALRVRRGRRDRWPRASLRALRSAGS